MKSLYLFLFFLLACFHGIAQTEVKLEFPVDTNLWEIGGDATQVDIDGINGVDEILLTPNKNAQNGYIKYKDFINFAQCEYWVLDFDFRLWSDDENASGEGFAFTLLNQYTQGEAGGNLGIPQTISSLGLVVAFDTYDNCNRPTHDNPEIQISEIDVYYGFNYTENCRPQASPRNAKLGTGNYNQDIKILRSPNYRPARIIYEGKNLSVLVDLDNDGTLDQVLGPTYLNLEYNYGMQMAFTASTGEFADNQSIKNVVMSIQSKEIISERELQKCPQEDILLEGGLQYLSYSWTDENGVVLGTDSSLTVSETGTYMLTKEFLCGTEIETIKVTESDLAIDSLSTVNGCGFVEIIVEASGGIPGYLYSIIDGASSQVINTFKVYSPGSYTVQIRDGNNCFVTKEIDIESIPPVMDLDLLQSSSNEITAIVTGGTPPFSYQFEDRNVSENNVFEIPGPGIFLVKVEDSYGCPIQGKIEVECEPYIIPNYFSPNGDGINDYWLPENMDCYPDFEATIYDRNGRKIYVLNSRNTVGWDGTNYGKELPGTDYWYSIRLNTFTKPISGHFNLYR